MAVGLAAGMGAALIGFGVKFVRDTKAALAVRDRPRQPWDVE